MVVWIFLAVPWVRLRFVIVVFPYHTHILDKNLSLKPHLIAVYAYLKGDFTRFNTALQSRYLRTCVDKWLQIQNWESCGVGALS